MPMLIIIINDITYDLMNVYLTQKNQFQFLLYEAGYSSPVLLFPFLTIIYN